MVHVYNSICKNLASVLGSHIAYAFNIYSSTSDCRWAWWCLYSWNVYPGFINLNTYCCARLYSFVPVVITHKGMDLVKLNNRVLIVSKELFHGIAFKTVYPPLWLVVWVGSSRISEYRRTSLTYFIRVRFLKTQF
jgi:hypothetical protein